MSRLAGLAFVLLVAAHPAGQAADSHRVETAIAERDAGALETWLHQAGPHAESVEAWRARAWLARAEGDQEAAMTALDRAVEAAPDDASPLVERARLRFVQIGESGRMRALKLARRARRDLERARELAPHRVDAILALLRFHADAPGIAGASERDAAALEETLRAVAPAAADARAARLLLEAGDADAALPVIRRALARDGSAPPDWRMLEAEALEARGRAQEAFLALEIVVDGSPWFAPARFEMGRLSAETGIRPVRGLAELEAYRGRRRWTGEPSGSEAWTLSARIHERLGDTAAADDARRRASEDANGAGNS